MSAIKFAERQIDPIQNHPVSNTATWGRSRAWEILYTYLDSSWEDVRQQIRSGHFVQRISGETPLVNRSPAFCRGADYFLAELHHKQNVG